MANRKVFEKNDTSKKQWEPRSPEKKSLNNLSAVKHNILTPNLPNIHSNGETRNLNLVAKFGTYHLKKGITEINDISRITNVNKNITHEGVFQQNSNVFKRKDGEHTHLYNAAARFGENKPFKY